MIVLNRFQHHSGTSLKPKIDFCLASSHLAEARSDPAPWVQVWVLPENLIVRASSSNYDFLIIPRPLSFQTLPLFLTITVLQVLFQPWRTSFSSSAASATLVSDHFSLPGNSSPLLINMNAYLLFRFLLNDHYLWNTFLPSPCKTTMESLYTSGRYLQNSLAHVHCILRLTTAWCIVSNKYLLKEWVAQWMNQWIHERYLFPPVTSPYDYFP